jgi:Xaa-Pro aminopeptidase
LHYIENNQQCKSGDLILIDAGAVRKLLQWYDSYYSVSGKYNDRQKPFTMPFYAKNEATKLVQEHFGNSTISK